MRADGPGDETAADADLVLRSRSGDTDAFGELWQRHYRSGIVAARSISHDLDADDLVQEAYAKVFQAIRRGGGPTGSFRAYLFTAIRNTAASWGSREQTGADEDLDEIEDPDSSEAAVDAALDRSLTVTAFRTLPSRWQEVLWYTEVEGMKPAEVAPLLGMRAGAVSQLAFRAREGLRESWIQAHISSVPDDSECRWTIERLGAHARDNLGSRDRAKVDAHIGECPKCAIVASEAEHVGSRLVMVLLPLAVGVTGAGGYLATLQRGGEQAMALAAMPGAVVEGTSVVAGESVGPELFGHGAELFGHLVDQGAALIGAAATGIAGLAGAGSASSGGAAGSAGSSSGGLLGVAGIVTAGVASLAIAAVVAGATILPGGWSGQGGASSALSDSAAAAEVEADESLAVSEEPEPVAPPAPKKPPRDEKPDRDDEREEPKTPVADAPPATEEEAAAEPAPGTAAPSPEPEQPPTQNEEPDDGTEEPPVSEEPDDGDQDDGTDDPETTFQALRPQADWQDDGVHLTVSGATPGESVVVEIDAPADAAGATATGGHTAAAPSAPQTATYELTAAGELDETIEVGDDVRSQGATITVRYADPAAGDDTVGTYALGPAPLVDIKGEVGCARLSTEKPFTVVVPFDVTQGTKNRDVDIDVEGGAFDVKPTVRTLDAEGTSTGRTLEVPLHPGHVGDDWLAWLQEVLAGAELRVSYTGVDDASTDWHVQDLGEAAFSACDED